MAEPKIIPPTTPPPTSPPPKKRIEKKELIVTVPVFRTPKAINGFLDFIRSYGVIAIAVGLYLGTSLKAVVDSITLNIVNPIISVISGNFDAGHQTVCLRSVDDVCKATINYGAVFNTIISFIIGAFVVYILVKAFKLDKFDKKKDS